MESSANYKTNPIVALHSLRSRKSLTNVHCPQRSQCLNDAWRNDPDFLDCTRCEHFDDRESNATISLDALGSMRLVWAIFINERMAERLPAEAASRAILGPRQWVELPAVFDI